MGTINLSDAGRMQLQKVANSRTVAAGYARRAKLVLMLDAGATREDVMSRLGCDSRFIARWSGRFREERLAGMYARNPGRAPKTPPAKLEARAS
jgi:hypothetical protein